MLYDKFARWPFNLLDYRIHASLANDRNTNFQFKFIESVEFAHNMGLGVGLPLLSEYSWSTSFQLVVCLAWLSFLFFSFFSFVRGRGDGKWGFGHPPIPCGTV
jgi:hypothetical protein